MTQPLASALLVAVGLAAGSCSGPTQPPGNEPTVKPPAEPPAPPPAGGGATIVSLHISGPAGLLLHESALYTVSGQTTAGYSLTLPEPAVFTSSDANIAAVSAAGVVTGRSRGNATITARIGTVVTSVGVAVRARVRIQPELSGTSRDGRTRLKCWCWPAGPGAIFAPGPVRVET